MPRPRRLFTGLSSKLPGFDARSVHVRFVVDKVAPAQFFHRVLPFSPFRITQQCSTQYHSNNAPHCITPTMLHTVSLQQCSTLISNTCCSHQKDKRAKSRNLPKRSALSKIGSNGWKILSLFLIFVTDFAVQYVSACLFHITYN